jgi:hypothetical protein
MNLVKHLAKGGLMGTGLGIGTGALTGLGMYALSGLGEKGVRYPHDPDFRVEMRRDS